LAGFFNDCGDLEHIVNHQKFDNKKGKNAENITYDDSI